MATKRIWNMVFGNGDALVFVEYNDNNMRVGNIAWELAPGKTMHAVIWNSGVEILNLTVQDNGSFNVPGNVKLEELPDDPGFFEFPSSYTYNVSVQ